MPDTPHKDDEGQTTFAGCVLMSLSLVLIGAVALPIVSWRDPDTGQPLPRFICIIAPILAGAAFYGIGTGILKVLGIAVLAKPKESPSECDDTSDGPERA